MKNMYSFLAALVLFAFWNTTVIAQWVITNWPQNRNINSFASNGSQLYAGSGDTPTGIGIAVFLSSDEGLNWTNVSNGLTGNDVWALAINGSNIFAGTTSGGWCDGGVFLSTNNGTNWTSVNTGLVNSAIHSLAVNGSNIFAGSCGGVFISSNNGESWSAVNNGLPNLMVQSLAVSGPNVLTIVSDASWQNSGLYISTDNGNSWSWTGLESTYLLTASGSYVFTGVGDSLFFSTDHGVTWEGTGTFSGFLNPPVFDIAAVDSSVFVLTNFGNIFHSNSAGRNWTLINEGLIDTMVMVLGISETYLFASGDHLWRRPLSEFVTSVDLLPGNLPTAFNLNQNYPNPFNPSTTISWQSPVDSWQTLRIYDLLGRVVATLVDEYKPAGSYEVEFNSHSDEGQNLSSGVYFYQLKAGEFQQTRKMILLR